MEISVNPRRRRHGEIRLLEKQMRPEVTERCLQFLDILINQIIYQENIYPENLFIPRQMYHSLVYQSIDKDISSYITLCVASLRDFFSQQLSDMISINITRNCQIPIILRRYLIELHTIYDPCLRAIYDNTKQLICQLDQAFAQCIQTIKLIKPLPNEHFNKGWNFQLRSCPNGRNNRGISVGEILRKNPMYKEFLLINQQSDLLSNGKQSIISSIKSLHTERLKLQLMCEEDKYEQEKFQQYNQYLTDHSSNDQQETDDETDSNPDEHQEISDEMNISSGTSRKSKDSELWPLTTVNNPPLCVIDEEEQEFNEQQQSKEKKKLSRIDSDFLIDRYHSTQKFNREDISDDEHIRPQSPFSPNNNWQEDDDEDEDL